MTDNELGSTALIAAGVVIAGFPLFADRVDAVEAAGVRFELTRQAKRAQQQAQQARAIGDLERADELNRRANELLSAASRIGASYEEVRATQEPGWDRTSRMEAVLHDARALDTEPLTAAAVTRIFRNGSAGDRIAALALIEADPRLATADVLVEAILNSRTAFEQYHALIGAEGAFGHLSGADRERILEAVKAELTGRLGETSSDRRTVARRIMDRFGPVGG